jgi:8-oxo-dGTP pyrophosphatase MutT (NUDIX family)
MRHAAVALILRERPGGPEVLFIQRAESENDPWSGQVAFPGGGLEDTDHSLADAAIRETLEETAIALRHELQIGRIDDLQGSSRSQSMNLAISCFVYRLDHEPVPVPNYEVAEVFWIPLVMLRDQSRQIQYLTRFRQEPYPAVHLGSASSGSDRILWGLTHRFIRRFLEIIS